MSYYVLHNGNIMNLSPYHRFEAERAINQQVKFYGSDREAFRITRYQNGAFIDDEGHVYCPRRGAYSREAWNLFIRGLQ